MANIRIALLALVAALSIGALGHAAAADLSEGEIRKVDKDNKKLTIRHGPIKNLDMPGMTMVFGVKDEAMLEQVQPGQKVRFEAEKMEGRIVVMKIEAADR